MFFILLFVVIFLLIAYIFVLRPYLKIQSIKKSFQSQGYKVLVQTLHWNDDTITASIDHDILHHKDALHRYKTTWQDYDVTIKNSFFAIYVSLNSIELVTQAYKKIEFMRKPWMMESNFGRFYGGGLLMKAGNDWKVKRKLYSEIFNFKLLQDLHPIVEKTVQNTMNNWPADLSFNILQSFRTMFLNTFLSCYFGRQFNEFSYKGEKYGDAVATAFQLLLVQTFSLRHMVFGTKFLQRGYLTEDKIIEERVAAIKLQTKEFVMKRWQEISQSTSQNSQKSILSKLVFNDQFKNLSEEQKAKALEDITGDVIMFFFAGTDTLSATLSATLHMLSKHPEVTKKLIQEINSSENTFTHSVIKNWKYMDAVMNEILRMYGPLNWIFVRQIAVDDLTIGGVNLSKDIIVGIQTQTVHYSSKFYEKPEQFIPERFLGERNQDPYSFVSFGGGQRNCIGQYLARIQYKVSLAKFLKKFKFRADEEFVMAAPSIYQSKNNMFTLTEKKDCKN